MAWLTANGPDLLFGAVILSIIGYAIWAIRKGGKDAVRAEQAEAEQAAVDIADEVQNDVGAIPPDKRREELRKWSK